MTILHGLLGIAVLLAVAVAVSEGRRLVPLRLVVAGLVLQLVLALILIKLPGARAVFLLLDQAVGALQKATDAGTTVVFGYLGGGQLPFAETQPNASFILAFRAFPLVLVISAIASLLF